MNWLFSILISLYILKLVIIFSWIAHSAYLMTFPRNINVYWNLISSIFLLNLDVLAHLIYFLRNTTKTWLFNFLLVLFLIGQGPVLLFLSLFGSITDSINYDQEFCKHGCALSIFFRDFHSILLYILSIFGLGCGSLFIYFLCFSRGKASRLLQSLFAPKTTKNTRHRSIHEQLLEKSLTVNHKPVGRTSSF